MIKFIYFYNRSLITSSEDSQRKMIKIILKNIREILLVFIVSVTFFDFPSTQTSNVDSCCSATKQKKSVVNCFSVSNSCSQESECNYCDIYGCCKTKANSAKKANSNNTNIRINKSKVYIKKHSSLAYLLIKKANIYIKKDTTQNRSLLPTFTTDQLLTISLLC